VVDYWKAAMDDWNIRDIDGKLQWRSSMKEETIGMFFRPAERTDRYKTIKKMLDVKDKISDMKERILQKIVDGDEDGATRLHSLMLSEYGEEYTKKYGKQIEPVTVNDVKQYMVNKEIPMAERIRSRLPGRGVKLPKGAEYPVGK